MYAHAHNDPTKEEDIAGPPCPIIASCQHLAACHSLSMEEPGEVWEDIKKVNKLSPPFEVTSPVVAILGCQMAFDLLLSYSSFLLDCVSTADLSLWEELLGWQMLRCSALILAITGEGGRRHHRLQLHSCTAAQTPHIVPHLHTMSLPSFLELEQGPCEKEKNDTSVMRARLD